MQCFVYFFQEAWQCIKNLEELESWKTLTHYYLKNMNKQRRVVTMGEGVMSCSRDFKSTIDQRQQNL